MGNNNIDRSANNKRIAKNTIIMYLRMIVMLIVSLFTARIVFNTLGVDSYGTYNLVGAIIIFFTFINNGLSSATKRYITAEIEVVDDSRIRHIFNTCFIAHIIIAIIVLITAETIGLWFLNYRLNIPDELITSANWAYQLSVMLAIVNIIQSPFSATIVAYEKMNIYAIFTITDVVFKLLVIYAVQAIGGDKLIIYSSLLFVVGIVNAIIFYSYAYYTIPICRLKLVKDINLLKEIFSFTSWSIMGQAAVVGTNQGVSILVNLFFNVAVNAAMGICNTIISVINGFVSNFQIAFNPQIIKSYNNKDYKYLQSLIVRASKLSSYLIIVFLVPLLFLARNVLELWLGTYPEYAVEFFLLTLGCIYLESIGAPLWMVVYAQSNIKKYQVIISIVYSVSFFGAWAALSIGAPPYSVITVRAFVFLLLLFIRLYYVKVVFPTFEIWKWITNVFVKSGLIIFVSALITWFANSSIFLSPLAQIICVTLVSLACSIPLIYIWGMSTSERYFVKNIFNKLANKFGLA